MKPMTPEERRALMAKHFATTQYERVGDWRNTPETFEDPDDDGPGGSSVEKADRDRIVRPFDSFQSEGFNMVKMISSLHTSRLSAYGFTLEADMQQVDVYAVSEQLDTKTCPVCRIMHGKTFKVSHAKDTLDQILWLDDPEQIKALQTWPKKDMASLEELRGLTEEELVERNWHIPPYHPWCRGLLVHVGSVPELEYVNEVIGVKPGDPSLAQTPESFLQYGISLNEEQVKYWNNHMGVDLGEFLSGMTDRPPLEIMDEVADAIEVAETGPVRMEIALDGEPPFIRIDFAKALEGVGKLDIDQMYIPSESKVVLNLGTVDSNAFIKANSLPKLFQSWYGTWLALGVLLVSLQSTAETTTVEALKAGFEPDNWYRTQDEMLYRLEQTKDTMPEADYLYLRDTLTMGSEQSLWELADNPKYKNFLNAFDLEAVLDFRNSDAAERFTAYIR